VAGYTEKVVIVGAGILGLACAFRLKQFGLHPLVLEASERTGGVIQTIRRNGFVFETGPQFPRFPEPVWTLVRDLHLENEFLAGDPKTKRYILRQDRLHSAPFSPGGLLSTGLVSLQSKLQILTEVFRHSSPPPEEEGLAEFVERKFGTEILDYLVDPIISTVFFGDSRKMGMESAFPALVRWELDSGSLVRGALRARKSKKNAANTRKNLRVTDALPSLGSFQSGMAALPERLAEKLGDGIRYGQEISDISRVNTENGGPHRGWAIHLRSGEQITTESLVLAVPAYAAATLLEKSAPQLASLLNAIGYAPGCVVSSAYDRAMVSCQLDGFGFMIPRKEGLHTICTFWNSSLFPSHSSEGKVLMTSFAGREGDSALFSASEEECAQIIEAENAKILGITGPPVDRVVWRSLRALPQYNVGHARRVSEISDASRMLPNLHLTGNFLNGRSIGDCVQIASRVAENVRSRLHGENIQMHVTSFTEEKD